MLPNGFIIIIIVVVIKYHLDVRKLLIILRRLNVSVILNAFIRHINCNYGLIHVRVSSSGRAHTVTLAPRWFEPARARGAFTCSGVFSKQSVCFDRSGSVSLHGNPPLTVKRSSLRFRTNNGPNPEISRVPFGSEFLWILTSRQDVFYICWRQILKSWSCKNEESGASMKPRKRSELNY